MDQEKIITTLAQSYKTTPAFLWIGNQEYLIQMVLQFLKNILCPNNLCNKCMTCSQIHSQQHHSIMWIKPERGYTLETIDPILQSIRLKQNANEHFFFILEKVELLSGSCANAFLKPLEEPPAGYHFILLTEQKNTIIPTISSRCIISSFYNEKTSEYHQGILDFFTHKKPYDPLSFLKTLESSKINEYDTAVILDSLLHHYIKLYKKNLISDFNQNKSEKILKYLSILETVCAMPIMPGSSKIVLKDLFLQWV